MDESPDFDPAHIPQVQVADLNGDGWNEILIAASYGRENPAAQDELVCFSHDGRVLWRYQPQAALHFVGRNAMGPWKLHAVTIVPDGDEKVVWAVFTDRLFAPTFVLSIDADGHSEIRYVSSGNVNALMSVSNEKGTFIVAGGVNNEYRNASLAVLDSHQPPSSSPQTEGNFFQCTNCPRGRPLLFVLLPRSEVNAGLGMPYNWVKSLYIRGGAVTASVLEQRPTETTPVITSWLELSPDFIPKNISFAAGYKEAHERLEKTGQLDHKWSDCQEQKHPATARVWTEAQGWRDVQVPWVH